MLSMKANRLAKSSCSARSIWPIPFLGMLASTFSIEPWTSSSCTGQPHARSRSSRTADTRAVADAALATGLAQLDRAWHRPGEEVSLIKGFLIVLMYSDDLKLAAERFRALKPRLQPDWEIRDVLVPLAASALPNRTELLLDLLPSSGNDTYWYEWVHALSLLPASDQRDVVRALLTNKKWTDGATQHAVRDRSLVGSLASIVKEDESLRQTITSAAHAETALPIRNLARHAIVAMGDPKSTMTMVEAALADPTLRSLAEAAIHNARWRPHPDQSNFPDYSAPQALTNVRKLLLHTAHWGSESSKEWARRVLLEMDSRLEGSYPVDEPRHPDLASGLAWPMAVSAAALSTGSP